MVNIGIIGATGYAGEELIERLLTHPQARIKYVCAKISEPKPIAQIFPKFAGRLKLICGEPEIEKIKRECDTLFLALPHTVSMCLVPALLKSNKKVIDLSADYRLEDIKIYEKFYHTRHKDAENLSKAVYGLPELYRLKIKSARFVANPGCYPTAAILSLAPVVSMDLIERESIIIDAKSGVTGAGRKIAESFIFSEINEDFKAYKVNIHQHAPEIDQELSKLAGKKIKVTFVPHLLPLNRGILLSIYAKKARKSRAQPLVELYKKFYKNEPFVRIREAGDFPRLKDVVHTNFCDIAVREEKDKVIIISAIDNLLKGAAGQAIQNFNIMYGFPESQGLL